MLPGKHFTSSALKRDENSVRRSAITVCCGKDSLRKASVLPEKDALRRRKLLVSELIKDFIFF